MPESSNLQSQITFLVEVDNLKSVLRRNYVIHGNRRENSAEHSWHATSFAMILAEHSNESIDVNRVMQMLTIHISWRSTLAIPSFTMMRTDRRRSRAKKKRRTGSLPCFPPSKGDHFAIYGTSLKLRLLQRQSLPRPSIDLQPFYTTTKRTVAGGAK